MFALTVVINGPMTGVDTHVGNVKIYSPSSCKQCTTEQEWPQVWINVQHLHVLFIGTCCGERGDRGMVKGQEGRIMK